VAFFSLTYNLAALLEELFSQMVLYFIKDLVVVQVVFEVTDLPQEQQLESLPTIFILECLLLHLYEDFWKYPTELVEYPLVKTGHRAVVGALHGCCPERLR